jgi:hypothetical protein
MKKLISFFISAILSYFFFWAQEYFDLGWVIIPTFLVTFNLALKSICFMLLEDKLK